MGQCYICGDYIDDEDVFDAFPFTKADDKEHKCCKYCFNGPVKDAKKFSSKMNDIDDIEVGDYLYVFYCNYNIAPVKQVRETGRFLTGKVTNKITSSSDEVLLTGTWGSFALTSNVDNFVKI